MFTRMFMAIALVCSIAFTWEPAEAQIRWFGFSDLKFIAEWRGGPCTDCVLSIQLIDFKIETRCSNLQTGEFCQRGQGNAGTFIFDTNTQCVDCSKNKGVITATGSIPLDLWDIHDPVVNPDHAAVHTCQPFNNPNKIEVPGSAHVTQLKTAWELRDSRGGLVRSGVQQCAWMGQFFEATCQPEDGAPFVCDDSEVVIKGSKK